MIRRVLLGAVVSLPLVGVIPAAAGATTHLKIGPHQVFAGAVNGSFGSPHDAVIRLVCPGPASPGETGHPLSGQTVSVSLSPSVVARSGSTGAHATSIGVFFGPPPPSAAGPGQVSFSRYDTPQPIPTSLTLPCSGSGVVTFVPFPESPPTSRAASVPVVYANVAVLPRT